MSKFEFKLPDIGEGVTEGEIVTWIVSVGDAVSEDQDLVEVMTDKATVTIGAPKAGRVSELRGNAGDIVPVGAVMVVLDLAAAGAESAATEVKAEAPIAGAGAGVPAGGGSGASAVGDIKEELPGTGSAAPLARAPGAKPLAAPATRKLARELGVDLTQVSPSGPGGRITRQDVEGFASSGASSGAAAAAVPAPAAMPSAGADDERVPIRGMRRRIFENMARSKRTAAHFTYVEECECSSLIELRARLKAPAKDQGANLSYLPFIVKAVVAALKRHPSLNALVDDDKRELVLKKSYNIGIAAATEAGLIVPVLRGADRLSLVEIAAEIERLAADARDGKTRIEDLGGASFTITSLGKRAGFMATPVVNYPEVAILYVSQMKKKPVVQDDAIVVGNVMQIAVSFDHRVIDGHVGADFTLDVVGMLQDPDRLMLNMG